ncbi:MAG: GNAT family N-acetyltransferase [Anaerolineae bacterium]
MQVSHYTDPSAYLRVVSGALRAREDSNTLLLGVAGQLVSQPERYPLPAVMLAVFDNAGLVLAALQTPPNPSVLLSTPRERLPEAARALVTFLDETGIELRGVNGPRESAEAVKEAWLLAHCGRAELEMRMRAYSLTRVEPPAGVPGRLRSASPADLDLAAEWVYAFNLEASGEGDRAAARSNAELRLAAGSLYLWEDGGRPVSMAVSTRPTLHSISIGGVYTPPEFRRHGYASACVAALSQLQLDNGWEYVALFTNLDYPTSNHIYQVIGYRPVCDYLEYEFISN